MKAIMWMPLLLLTLSYGPAENDSAEVAAAINKDGARAVVAQMTKGSGMEWNRTMREIKTGSPKWLQIAYLLRDGTDASNTESVYYAISYALLRAPNLVLPMIGAKFPLEAVCTVPDIEPSQLKVRLQVKRARVALQSVNDPKLAEIKQRCLASYEKLSSAK